MISTKIKWKTLTCRGITENKRIYSILNSIRRKYEQSGLNEPPEKNARLQ
jgi:hypothetical protein